MGCAFCFCLLDVPFAFVNVKQYKNCCTCQNFVNLLFQPFMGHQFGVPWKSETKELIMPFWFNKKNILKQYTPNINLSTSVFRKKKIVWFFKKILVGHLVIVLVSHAFRCLVKNGACSRYLKHKTLWGIIEICLETHSSTVHDITLKKKVIRWYFVVVSCPVKGCNRAPPYVIVSKIPRSCFNEFIFFLHIFKVQRLTYKMRVIWLHSVQF